MSGRGVLYFGFFVEFVGKYDHSAGPGPGPGAQGCGAAGQAQQEVAALRRELDTLQAASMEELERKQTEMVAVTEEVELLRRKNQWLQKSVKERTSSLNQ